MCLNKSSTEQLKNIEAGEDSFALLKSSRQLVTTLLKKSPAHLAVALLGPPEAGDFMNEPQAFLSCLLKSRFLATMTVSSIRSTLPSAVWAIGVLDAYTGSSNE